MKVIIIGNGTAGNSTAQILKQSRKDIHVTMISAEEFPEYDPCSLPYYIGGQVPREMVFKKMLSDYQKMGIDLVVGKQAVAIDPRKKRVITNRSHEFRYDRLVLANGGSLHIPPISGIGKKGVFFCKQLADADRLAVHSGKTAVIIGSGAIGIEVAEALVYKGFSVEMIEVQEWILPGMFCKETSSRLEKDLERHGIKIRKAEIVQRIEGNEHVRAVVTNRRRINCDTVVIAAGVVPGNELARTAGIEINRGILVNSRMETSAPDIYACGDVVETFDFCSGDRCLIPLKHNAMDQARIAAINILGKTAVYHGAYSFARTHFFDTRAVSFGKTMKTAGCLPNEIDIIEKESGLDYLRILVKDGCIIGGQAIGKYADATGLFMGAMWRKDNFYLLRNNWKQISTIHSPYPWVYRKMGEIIGYSSHCDPVFLPGGIRTIRS